MAPATQAMAAAAHGDGFDSTNTDHLDLKAQLPQSRSFSTLARKNWQLITGAPMTWEELVCRIRDPDDALAMLTRQARAALVDQLL